MFCGETGHVEFEESIRRHVPYGYTFKAFSEQFGHASVDRICDALGLSASFQSMIAQRGDGVRLAVRVRVFPYMQHAVATWVLVAVCYRDLA